MIRRLPASPSFLPPAPLVAATCMLSLYRLHPPLVAALTVVVTRTALIRVTPARVAANSTRATSNRNPIHPGPWVAFNKWVVQRVAKLVCDIRPSLEFGP